MKKILLALTLIAPVFAHAEGKAYRYIFDKPMSESACLGHATKVARAYRLKLLDTNETGDRYMVAPEGEISGVAYYSEATCHVYVY